MSGRIRRTPGICSNRAHNDSDQRNTGHCNGRFVRIIPFCSVAQRFLDAPDYYAARLLSGGIPESNTSQAR